MSESNLNDSQPSQESVNGGASSSAVNPESHASITEDEKVENVKAPASKISKPTGLKLMTTSNPNLTTRIGRLCNSVPKPAIPPNPASTKKKRPRAKERFSNLKIMQSFMRLSDYGSNLKLGHGKALTNESCANGGYNGSFRETFADRVSLRDIGIRLPVVHFDLNHRRQNYVSESDENSVPYYGNGNWSYDRKMSSGSVLSDSSRKSEEFRGKRSSDASSPADFYSDYWRNDAEQRRPSDASVVLTEDTDQFIIGDRVWVGGAKPGQIAYIGETQFAPGEWAGVVLDEPIGKNDGTVANIRYFQCEPKKGIFSRLTRLTRYPMVDGGTGESAASRATPTETKRTNGSLLASVSKKSSLVLPSPAPSKNSVSKPPSPDPFLQPNVQVGDRVIVKSSRGSKVGILRYMGTTGFAPGEWCGVELDDPLGKNDGSVAGTRYFECRPNFGLFAPVHKVSKSPTNKRPSQGNCVIHNRSGAATSGLRRQGSKESLASLSSTASATASVRSAARKVGVRTPTTPTSAKNALQETLKEKELHIEQLLKERDLERAEVTRAASQADEAERRLVALKQEFEQQKEEAEARISDLDALVCLFKSQNEELKNILDDERKKYEDLQFRFEEETIDKADIKSLSVKFEEKIKMLEKTLFEERKRTEPLEQDSNKLFEAEEQMVILKDELDSAKEEIAGFKKLQSDLKQEHISLEAHLTSARAEIESLKIENESLKSSSFQEQTKLLENNEKAFEAFEKCKVELEQQQKENERLKEEISFKEQSFLEKEKEMHAKYLKIITELTEKHKSETANVSKQLENSRNSSETKLKVLENQLEEKMKLCSSLETQLNESKIFLSKITAERSGEEAKHREFEEELENKVKRAAEDIARKKQQLVEETAKNEKLLREKQRLEEEIAEARKMVTLTNESTDKQVVFLNGIIEQHRQELENMKREIQNKSEECRLLQEGLAEREKGEKERLEKVEKLLAEKNSDMEEMKKEMAKDKKERELKSREMHELHEAREGSLEAKIKDLQHSEAEKGKEAEALKRDLETAKSCLAEKENQLKTEEDKSRNLSKKVTLLEEDRRKLEKERDDLQLEASDATRKMRSVEEKLAQVVAQKAKLESDISEFVNTSNDSSLRLASLNEDLRLKEKEVDTLRDEFSEKIRSLERAEQALKQSLENRETEVKRLKEEAEKARSDQLREVDALKSKLKGSVASSVASGEEWKKKMEDLKRKSDSLVQNLEERIRAMKEKATEERNQHEEEVKKVLAIAEEELKKKLSEAETAAQARENLLEEKIEMFNVERNSLLNTIEQTRAELQKTQRELTEALVRNTEMHAVESEKLRNELKETSEKLAATVGELISEKDEKNRLNEEKAKLEKMAGTMEELVKELQAKNREVELKASFFESENKVLKGTVNQLTEEKCSLFREGTENVMQLTEVRSQLEEETTTLKGRLQEVTAAHEAELSEKAQVVARLRNEVEKLKRESAESMAAAKTDAEKSKAEANQLKKEIDDRRSESEKKSEEMKELVKRLQQAKEELETQKKRGEEYEKQLNASETEKLQLKGRFEEQSKMLSEHAELGGTVTELRQKLSEAQRREQETMNNAKLEKQTLEKMLETTKGFLNQREKEAEDLKREKGNLASEHKAMVEALQKQKMDLQNQLEEAKRTQEKAEANTKAGGDEGRRELQEEREFQKGQVDFLNSVIVDMQKKNDALKARIEILEMGFSPEDVDEFNLHNITTKSVAPRLFCDICDRFDLHDTEDCPTQANEDVPPPKSSKARVPPPERPYCEICEVFGHDTADCDDGETF